MRNLGLLILYHNKFSGNLNFLSNNLRYLLWHGYPFTALPSNFEPYYLVELNMPDSSIQQLWEGHKDLPYLKRMDLSNSKYLIETPKFFSAPKLERLDFTGCTNLINVHPSIGHLTELAFLSLQNCSSLINLDFGSVPILSSLRVLRLCGCTKLEKTPVFIGASNLEYLDMDGCTSLSTVHESIGALAKLRFLSLMNCTNLVGLPNNINRMTSLQTLDLSGCSKLTTLPQTEQSPYPSHYPSSLICIDVSFCNLLQVPDAIGELHGLERLNLKGNNFDSLPSSFGKLRSLAYLNLAHCHKLQTFPQLPTLVEKKIYFETTSGSHDRRSGGLYIFDCPKIKFTVEQCSQYFGNDNSQWLQRLLKQHCRFRHAFDIIIPWDSKNIDCTLSCVIPEWFHRQFDGGSRIRIVPSNFDFKWLGFVFCVAFEVNNHAAANSGSLSSPLPHPFYLSFEGEETEERFHMPLSLELDKIDGSKHLWIIYISRDHCHFVKTGAHITFKACPGLLIKKWGLRMLINKNPARNYSSSTLFFEGYSSSTFIDFEESDLLFDYVEESISWSGPKIQLPYNWLVTEEEEVENYEAKSKETDLSNLGLQISLP